MIKYIKRLLSVILLIFVYLLIANNVPLKKVLYAKIVFEGPIFLNGQVTQIESSQLENLDKYSIKGSLINIELKSEFEIENARNDYINMHKHEIDYDDMLRYARSESRDYYYRLRSNFYNKNNKFLNLNVSYESSPIITYKTNEIIQDFSDISNTLFYVLNDSNVEKMYISTVYTLDTQIDPIECVTQTCSTDPVIPTPLDPNYDISVALETSNITNLLNTYNGNGIKSGIHEGWYSPKLDLM